MRKTTKAAAVVLTAAATGALLTATATTASAAAAMRRIPPDASLPRNERRTEVGFGTVAIGSGHNAPGAHGQHLRFLQTAAS